MQAVQCTKYRFCFSSRQPKTTIDGTVFTSVICILYQRRQREFKVGGRSAEMVRVWAPWDGRFPPHRAEVSGRAIFCFVISK